MAYEKAALEQTVLDIAERQLFRYGYRNLNLNEVAREAGISKVTLYKLFQGKYEVAERAVERLLAEADREMAGLFRAELPLREKLERGIGLLSSLYLKMDRDFLYDLEHSLPRLWERIEAVRAAREGQLAGLLAAAQAGGEVRGDVDPALLAALIMALVREVYRPAFFLDHSVSADAVGRVVTGVFLDGVLSAGPRD